MIRKDIIIGLVLLAIAVALGYDIFRKPNALALEIAAVSANCQDAAKPNNPAYWVSVTRSSALPRWQLTSCVWQDIDTSGGNHNLYINVVDEHGAPATVYAFQAWPDPVDSPVKQITAGGATNFGLYGGSFDPRKGGVGAYSSYVEGTAVSDIVSGMGLPLDQHVNYFLLFQRVVAAGPTATPGAPTVTPRPGTPTPTAIPSDFVTHSEFRNLLIDTLNSIQEKGR